MSIKNTFLPLLSVAMLSSLSVSYAASPSRLSDIPITPDYSGYERTAPLFEMGQPFLNTGNIDPGFELPTGAVWQPQLLVFGDFRTALQFTDTDDIKTSEWANRLNLFAQLKLTGTERLLIGIRPLDKNGVFSGKQNDSGQDSVSINETDLDIETLYFEGDFGEIFPNLDPTDTKKLDWGFAVGRMPILIQEGLLIDDTLDAIGIVRNSITLPGVANLRVTAFYSWDEVNRNDNTLDNDAALYGLFTEFDTFCCTIDIDFAYVNSDDALKGSGYVFGISSVQRLGHWNTSFRALHSEAKDEETSALSTGSLFFVETSVTPTSTHDILYINAFYGIDQFSSAARNNSAGGPLARTGILFEAVGLGRYGSALSNQANDVYGASIGYQKFMNNNRQQVIFELASRNETKGEKSGGSAIGARYQQAFGKHTIFIVDGYLSETDQNDSSNGIRTELRLKF